MKCELKGHTDQVQSLSFANSNRTLVSASEVDSTIRVWDIDGATTLHVLPASDAVSVAGSRLQPLAAVTCDFDTVVCNTETGRFASLLERSRATVFGPAASELMAGTWDEGERGLKLWDLGPLLEGVDEDVVLASGETDVSELAFKRLSGPQVSSLRCASPEHLSNDLVFHRPSSTLYRSLQMADWWHQGPGVIVIWFCGISLRAVRSSNYKGGRLNKWV